MSAKKSGTRIDFRGIIDGDIDPGVPGGRELVALAHSATLTEPDPSALPELADAIGPARAVTAVELAGAFQMINRVMDATGSSVTTQRLEVAQPYLELLGAMDQPHANLVASRQKKSALGLRKIAQRLRR